LVKAPLKRKRSLYIFCVLKCSVKG
jgi:hypothetical protein